MRTIKIRKEGELLMCIEMREDTVTVGNNTCDIPVPDEERLLFAIEMARDAEIGHIYPFELPTFMVNGKTPTDMPVEIALNDTITLDTGVQLEVVQDVWMSDDESEKSTSKKTAGVPVMAPLNVLERYFETLSPLEDKSKEEMKEPEVEEPETEETETTLTEEMSEVETPKESIKPKQIQRDILEYFRQPCKSE